MLQLQQPFRSRFGVLRRSEICSRCSENPRNHEEVAEVEPGHTLLWHKAHFFATFGCGLEYMYQDIRTIAPIKTASSPAGLHRALRWELPDWPKLSATAMV